MKQNTRRAALAACLALLLALPGCGGLLGNGGEDTSRPTGPAGAGESSSAGNFPAAGNTGTDAALATWDFSAYDASGIMRYSQPMLGTASFLDELLAGMYTSRGVAVGDNADAALAAYGTLLGDFSFLSPSSGDWIAWQHLVLQNAWRDAGSPATFTIEVRLYERTDSPYDTYTYENLVDFPDFAGEAQAELFQPTAGWQLYNLAIHVVDGRVADIETYMELGG